MKKSFLDMSLRKEMETRRGKNEKIIRVQVIRFIIHIFVSVIL